MKREPTITTPADKYRDKWTYTFPLPHILNPKFGRIEAHVEPIVKRGKITTLLIWFTQHEIEHFKGVVFAVECPGSGMISTHTHNSEKNFMTGVWSISPCVEHRSLILSSYPPSGTKALVISALTTSIGIDWTADTA